MSVRLPTVSVVIPTYNSSWLIGRTLSSVMHQTLNDIEILVVDDGSTDDLEAAIAPIVEMDNRIRVIRQENRGLAGARNRGIAEARASLIAPIDADDLWHPEFLEACVNALQRVRSAPFAFAYSFRMDQDDILFPYVVPRTPPRHDFFGLLSVNSVGCGSAAVFRRDALLQAGAFDEEMGRVGLHGAEDWKLVLQLSKRASPVLVPRHLVGYRFIATSMSQKNPIRQLRAIHNVIQYIALKYPDVPKRALRDGKTMMTAWLLPAFARNGHFITFIRYAFGAYVFNPFWFTNPLLRRAHLQRLQISFGSLLDILGIRKAQLKHLREAEMEGRQPFSYLR
jgi:glycosyltransferase involved in cell wall biosynthesis